MKLLVSEGSSRPSCSIQTCFLQVLRGFPFFDSIRKEGHFQDRHWLLSFVDQGFEERKIAIQAVDWKKRQEIGKSKSK